MLENAILAGLEKAEADAVVAHGKLVDLPVRFEIYQIEKPIVHVYFPLDCVLSVVARMQDGLQIEIGTIGREGNSGIPLLLGAETTANEAYCQVPGRAIVIEAAFFMKLTSNAKVRQLMDRYLQAYLNMLGQMAACNRLHNVAERCARWLLMTQDRAGGDKIALTHEFLAMMLGTQRSGVTIAAGLLQRAGFIRYANGKIVILDRAGLENASCECYHVARDQFAGLLRYVYGESASTRQRK